MTDVVLAAQTWRSNAELIADVARLGYLLKTDHVLDPTYNGGVWWKNWCPDHLTFMTRELDPTWDFRDMSRYGDDAFDVVAFDPPYVSKGGRSTSGVQDMDARYGLFDAPSSPAGVQLQINAGLRECNRVARRHVFVKCQNYVSSGQLFGGEYETYNFAVHGIGMKCTDRFVHVTKSSRPQPSGRRQVHARNNVSTLFVFSPSR